jgi:peptidoglycan/LPS O-acetylase OafA/YrhL
LRRLPDKIPSLDGLRAVSIFAVLLSHFFIRSSRGGALRNIWLAFAENGRVGVSVFFIISGFLITTLLMREQNRFDRVSLPAFFRRRAFRILPAFFFYVCIVAVLNSLGIIFVPYRDFWHAITFTTDYEKHPAWYLGHIWSLSVEEQFYLVWPILFVYCGRKTLAWFAALVIVVEPLIRVINFLVFPASKMDIKYMAHDRADLLMFGCLAALLFEDSRFQEGMKKAYRWKLPLICAVFLVIISPLIEIKGHETYLIVVAFSLQGGAITLIMMYLIDHCDGVVGKVFNSRVVMHVGVLSYSLYLWQELFLGAHAYSVGRRVLGLICAVLLAETSFYFVEQPMLRVRRRFETRRPARAGSYEDPLSPSESGYDSAAS